MIRQLHLNECDSTQDVLKEQLTASGFMDKVLVSCENQTAGRGRGENKWISMPGTLCFSFNLEPHPVMSFTAIEISTIIALFFESRGITLKLKWPNDLWNSDSLKCGGILVQGHQSMLIAGVGINLFSQTPEFGGIYPAPVGIDKKELSLEIVTFIHANRLADSKKLTRLWLERCGHLNDIVRITEGEESFDGVFQGLGDYGEAIVCQNGQQKKIFNGTLRLA